MPGPHPDVMHALYEVETPVGDTYGRGVSHLVMPNGSLVACSQLDDDMCNALSRAVFAAHTKEPISQ